MNPEDFRGNLEEGIRNTCNSNDSETFVPMINLHIGDSRFNVPKLDEGERGITTIVDIIVELGRHDEKYLRDTIRGELYFLYREKFRHDVELKALANEKLPNREGIRIPM